MNRISFLLLGIVTLVFGASIIINPQFFHSGYKFVFDFSSIKWPFGGGLIILGALFIWSYFRKQSIEVKKEAEDDKKY